MDLILVVCGAGASSTFLASRMRKLATERGTRPHRAGGQQRSISPRGCPTREYCWWDRTSQPDFAQLASQAAEHSVPAALLPPTAFGPQGATDALDQALAMLNATTEGTVNA